MLLHFRRSPMGWFWEPVSVPNIYGPLRNSAKKRNIDVAENELSVYMESIKISRVCYVFAEFSES